MSAIRLARGFTGRAKVVKFAGLLPRPRRRAAGLGRQRARDLRPARLRRRAGAMRRPRRSSLPYNDVAALEAAFAEHGDEIACRDHRGGAGQHGRRAARSRASPRRCAGSPRAHGALLVSDEVMTGFRVRAAGWYGLEGPYDEGPPTCSPSARSWAAASPPRRSAAAPTSWRCSRRSGPVYQAGTLSGNPVATAAGPRDAARLHPEVYDRLGVVAEAIADGGVRRRSAEAGVPHVVQWAGSMFSRLLPRRRGAQLRRRDSDQDPRRSGVLPLDAEPGRAPAAERVRVVVRQRRARRRRRRAGGRRPARGGAGRASQTAFATLGA